MDWYNLLGAKHGLQKLIGVAEYWDPECWAFLWRDEYLLQTELIYDREVLEVHTPETLLASMRETLDSWGEEEVGCNGNQEHSKGQRKTLVDRLRRARQRQGPEVRREPSR